MDLDNSMISITKTVQRLKSENHEHKTQLYILEPKSTSSIRSVILPDFLTEYLKKYNDLYNKDFFILSNKEIPVDPRIIQKNFRKICKANDIDATFHTLRHTYATNCIKTNIDVKTLGHANVNITLNRYVHTSLDFKKQQINKIEPPIKP
ncbi:MAG: site-specific integrase [Faecalibacillus intestinalis]|nr:site-specific integrase [Faecalibacillus intestinalis]